VNELIRRGQGHVTRRPDNMPTRQAAGVAKRNTRQSVGQAFPIGPKSLNANGRYVNRQPEVIVVEKKVLAGDLRAVLTVFAVVILLAFVVGLVLWVMS
jgi:hypothetical protein